MRRVYPIATLVRAWKRGAPPLDPNAHHELVAAGKMKREESPLRLQDVEGASRSSCTAGRATGMTTGRSIS